MPEPGPSCGLWCNCPPRAPKLHAPHQPSPPDSERSLLQTVENFGKYCEYPGKPWCLSGKGSACRCTSARDMGSIPGLGRSSGEGNGNPLQYSCLGNPIDRGAWWATVHGVAEIWTQLSNKTTVSLSSSKKSGPLVDFSLDGRSVSIPRPITSKLEDLGLE